MQAMLSWIALLCSLVSLRRTVIPRQSARNPIEPNSSTYHVPHSPFNIDEIAHLKVMVQKDKTHSSEKLRNIIIAAGTIFGGIGAMVGAIATIYGIRSINATTLLYNKAIEERKNFESQAATLQGEVNNLKLEKNNLERDVESIKTEKAKFESQAIKLIGEKNTLEDQKKNLEGEVINVTEEKLKAEQYVSYLAETAEYLGEQNNTLSNKNSELAGINKQIIYRSFFNLVYTSLDLMEANPVISIFIKWEEYNHMTYYSTGIRCAAFYKFTTKAITSNCWIETIQDIKRLINTHSSENKIEILPSNVTLERIFMDSIVRIEKWGSAPKEITDELREKVRSYIQIGQDYLKIPLNFNLTGLDMKLTDANKDIQRLYSIFNRNTRIVGNIPGKVLEAEVFNLEQYLGHERVQNKGYNP